MCCVCMCVHGFVCEATKLVPYYFCSTNPAGQPRLSALSLMVVNSDSVLFSLNCPSSSFPPTSVAWLHNGALFSEGQSFQVLREASSTRFDNILHVAHSIGGNFTCTVSNSEGSATDYIIIKGTSGEKET